MPTLHWIGKDKIINHHQDVPYKVLNHQYGFSNKGKTETPIDSGNLIINGDNLEALKSLLPKYEGKVNCIYIDPPYNTGNEGWVYNDNTNSPQIKKWLGKVVGKESEDLTRHDKWLCMMYPRLKLLHKLLAKDGVIFISIDDHELSHLKIMMDEIFGPYNFVDYFCWTKTSTPPSLANKSRKTVEYVLCFEKRKTSTKYVAELGDGGDAPLLNSGNPLAKIKFRSEDVFFKMSDVTFPAGQYDKCYLHQNITIKNGYSNIDFELTGTFKWIQKTINLEISQGTTFVIKSDKFSMRFLRTTDSYKAPTNLLKEKYFTTTLDKKNEGIETNEGAKKDLENIFGKYMFDYPKPTSLVSFFINLIENPNSIILDSFAGSGTTAHAVLNLNKQDGGNRKFILIEMENYAETITAERVKRVINGYGEDSKAVEGTGGNFDYYTLGEPLFDDNNNLNENIPIEKIQEYVWFTETRSAYSPPLEGCPKDGVVFLGNHNDTGYYFIYDKDNLTTLDYDSLAAYVQQKAERYIIYADNCLLPETFLREKNIEFKKIPRDITRF
ncbi:site-specific DNA-methyltransferase [Flavobacterium sp. 7A]|uniref:site-specific DNA-methyltransferase n=1 Tax=Flavobacterium sp. 7A TaxID=2940571 RepID=UPI002227EA9D|nr:site-specific DNA-methyltransferase [Flavobacterium sp. 7A]MCW2119102.1 adenine-specific DNA-methyltransferase [Flavobacterium sp. 7A]